MHRIEKRITFLEKKIERNGKYERNGINSAEFFVSLTHVNYTFAGGKIFKKTIYVFFEKEKVRQMIYYNNNVNRRNNNRNKASSQKMKLESFGNDELEDKARISLVSLLLTFRICLKRLWHSFLRVSQ